MAGVENEKDFYKLFPTEEAFFGMYPEAKKLVQKAYGGLIQAQQGVEYKGPSIVDYLATKGYQGSKPFRKQLAQEYGVEGYDYSPAKNLELLGKLRENQEILSQHEKSFSPVTVEFIEQLHQKNKAGLDRHTSLPGRQEAKKQVNLKRLNALLDIASLPNAQSLGAPLPSLSFKNATTYSNVKKKQQPKPSNPIEEGEYDVQEKPKTKVTESPSLGITDYLNVASHLIPELYTNYVQSIYDSGSEAVKKAKDFGTQGLELLEGLIGGAERKIDMMQEEDKKSIKPISEKTVTINKLNPQKNNNLIAYGYKEIFSVPDSKNPKNSLAAFTNTFDNDQGGRYFIGHKAKEVTDAGAKKSFENAQAVAHFLRDADILPNQKINPSEWNTSKGYRFRTTSPGKTVSATGFDDPERYRMLYKPNPKNDGSYLIKYVKNKEINSSKEKQLKEEGWSLDFTVSSQHKFSDIDWDKKGVKTGYLNESKWVPLKSGDHTYIPYKTKDGFSRFSGGSGIYLFTDPKTGKRVGVDVSGSVNVLKKTGQDIIKTYGIKPEDLDFAYHDMGSYSAKPKAKKGDILDYNQWLDFNTYNRGFSGAPIIIPKNMYGGPVLPKAQFGIGQTIGQKVLPGLQKVQGYFNQNASNFKPPSEALPGDIALEQQMFPTTTTTTNFKQFWESSQLDVPKYKDIYGQDVYDQTKWLGDPNYNVSTTTTNPSPNYLFGNVGKFFDENAAGIKTIASLTNMGFALGNTLAAQKEYSDFQKNLERNLRNKIFTNPVMPSVSGSRGDYTQTGAFRPNEYTVNKGMYTSNMPGAVVGTQQFTKFGGPILQFGGGAIEEAIVPAVSEFSPMVFSEPTTAPEVAEKPKSYKHSGANPIVEKTWDEISKQYSGVKFLGIWGDPSHQKRKSDHNSGNAIDIGILNTEQGDKIAEQLISEADDKRIKYLIFNRKIWSPEDGWKTYTPTKANGNNPHTSHVHVSFYPYEGTKRKAGESIAVSHNNPGNIHFGEFTSQWGAEKGMYDNKGHVAKFNSIDEGWEALQQLLFGSNYNNLSILEARNKWVTGKPNTITDSSKFIAKELGIDGNVPISKLSPSDKIKLASLFVKYEDNKMYKKMKDLKYFEMGGQVSYNEGEEYDLTEDEIRQILENGGDLEYI